MKSCTSCGARNINDKEPACPICSRKQFGENGAPAPPPPPLPRAAAELVPQEIGELLVWTEPVPGSAPLNADAAMLTPGPRRRQTSISSTVRITKYPDQPSFLAPLSSGYRIYPDTGADLQECESRLAIPASLGGPADSLNVIPVLAGVWDKGVASDLQSNMEAVAGATRSTGGVLKQGQTVLTNPPRVQLYLYYHPDGDPRLPVWFYAQLFSSGNPDSHYCFPHFVARGAGAADASPDEARAFAIAHGALGSIGRKGTRIAQPYSALQWLHDQYYGAEDAPVRSTPEVAAYLQARSAELGKSQLQMGDLALRHRIALQQPGVKLLGLPDQSPIPFQPFAGGGVSDKQQPLVLKHNAWWYQQAAGPAALHSDALGSAAAQFGDPQPDIYDVLSEGEGQNAPVAALIRIDGPNRFDNIRLHSRAHEDTLRRVRLGLAPAPNAAPTDRKAEIEQLWGRHEAGLRGFYRSVSPDLVARWSAFQALLNGPLIAKDAAV